MEDVEELPVQKRDLWVARYMLDTDICSYVMEMSNRSGQTIGANDLFVAAHARSLGLTLVTNNVPEFGRVPGLQVKNWALPAG